MDPHEALAFVALLVAAQTGRTLGRVVASRRAQYGEEPTTDTPPEDPPPAH